MKLIGLAGCFLFWFMRVELLAQHLPPVIIMPVDPPPGVTSAMTVERAEVDVRLHGFVADTTMTLVFGNPNPVELAGELYVPLPEGAFIGGYALDVAGRMVDGVPVEKEKGRVVFEKIVRAGIDPGLVEYTRGNVFKTRVYPIPPNGSRTVRLRYVSELLSGTQGAVCQVPLNFPGQVGEFRLRVEVVRGETHPEVLSDGWRALRFESWRDSLVAELVRRDEVIQEDLHIALPDVEKQRVVVERNPNGEVYFAVFDEAPAVLLPEVPPPERVMVFWDASASRKGDRERELGVLEQWLRQQAGELDVSLVVFRDVREEPRVFSVREGDAGELLEAIRALEYDGGTRLAVAMPPPGLPAADVCLFFSDGLNTLGGEDLPEGFAGPVYVFSDGLQAAHASLRYLAASTGGAYFNLARVPVDEAVAQIGRQGLALESVVAKGASVKNLTPGIPVPAMGRLVVTGWLAGDEAIVTLRYGAGGGSVPARTFRVSADDAAEGDILRLFWAQRQLDEWLMQPERNADAVRSLSRAHGLVTPETSLIVLESLAQYLEHEIRPPASWPEVRQEYDQQMAIREKQKADVVESRIEQVLALWRERIAWWEKTYAYKPGFKYREQRERHGRPEQAAYRMAAGSRSPAPAMAGAAYEAEAMDGFMEMPEEGMDENELGGRAAPPDGVPPGERAAIHIEPWNPDTPYLRKLEKASGGERYQTYLALREEYGGAPAFYLDCADVFMRQGKTNLAIRVLTNIAEMELENAALLRVLGHRLRQFGRLDESIALFEEVRRMRPEEPQSWRDLALVLAERGERRLAAEGGSGAGEELRRAMELLYHVVVTRWDRFAEIELTALLELNRLLAVAAEAGIEAVEIDARLIKRMDLDTRIVMTWDADMTDIDLWVTEPSGEKAMYSHNRTTIGGLVSRDFTQGYGPEEYWLRRAMPGTYLIEANFYGSGAPQLIGAVTVQVDVFTDYARPSEQRQSLTLRLENRRDTYKIGEIVHK